MGGLRIRPARRIPACDKHPYIAVWLVGLFYCQHCDDRPGDQNRKTRPARAANRLHGDKHAGTLPNGTAEKMRWVRTLLRSIKPLVPSFARTEGETELQRLSVGLLVERPPRLGVLFLNFDSTICTAPNGNAQQNPALEETLRRNKDVDIILSTTWPNGRLEKLKQTFSADIARRVIGITPDLENLGGTRQDEIQHIVNAYHIHNWVALDDQAHLYQRPDSRLLLIDPRKGLTGEQICELDRVFGSWRVKGREMRSSSSHFEGVA